MKRRHLIFLLVLLLPCFTVAGQTYRYNFSHDTIGNRLSRVYQGVRSSDGSNPSSNDTSGDSSDAESNVVDSYGLIDGVDSTILTAQTDTARRGFLIKTPEEKDAYLKQMMEVAWHGRALGIT